MDSPPAWKVHGTAANRDSADNRCRASDNAALKRRIRMYLNIAPFVHNVFQSFRLLHAACCGSVNCRYFFGRNQTILSVNG